jgi:hypothetical protein
VELSELEVKQSVDIWSLGCVYSEAARWVAGGCNGLKEYRAERKAETNAIRGFRDGDCFHNGEKALKAVHMSHRKTRECLRWQDCITEQVIDTMIKPMLEVDDRPTAMQVWRTSQRIFSEAEERLDQGGDALIRGRANTFPPPQPNLPPPPVLPFSRPEISHPPATPPNVEEQYHEAGGVVHSNEYHMLRHSPDSILPKGVGTDSLLLDPNTLNHQSTLGEFRGEPHGKFKSVSFGTYQEPGSEPDVQIGTIGIAKSTTASFTRPLHDRGYASGGAAIPEPDSYNPDTPSKWPGPKFTTYSDVQNALHQDGQTNEQRSSSSPAVDQPTLKQTDFALNFNFSSAGEEVQKDGDKPSLLEKHSAVLHSPTGLEMTPRIAAHWKVTNATASTMPNTSPPVQNQIFFGVPSRGMDISSLLPMVKDQPNEFLLRALGPESRILRDQSINFKKMFDNKRPEIIYFYECKMSPTAKKVSYLLHFASFTNWWFKVRNGV